ncbi:MAG: hypothetical protein EBY50_09825 [Rhodobacteraceae bacterium]|nr:hypothetical protein [Paracoccaceae bacterium]
MTMPHNAVDIWLHAASAADISASLALYERLLQQDDFDFVLSCLKQKGHRIGWPFGDLSNWRLETQAFVFLFEL